MKYRRSVGLLLGLSLLALSAPSALAHETPSPTPSLLTAPLSDQELYKLAMENFRINSVEFKRISRAFTAAVNRANNIYEAAMRAAKSDKARTLIMAQRDSSIEVAINIRDAAIEEMGGAPVEPVKPVKPTAAVPAKKTKTNSPSPTPSP